MSVLGAVAGKLRPRYYGPYKITEAINQVAFRLQLPPGARIHDVFHIGLLKKFVGTPPDSPPSLPPMHHGAAILQPLKALKTRLARGVRQILVQWKDQPASSTSWEDIEDFIQKYPAFQLEDELLVEGGRDVMWGQTYGRRTKARTAEDG